VNDREELLAGIKAKGIVHGDFELSSGAHATTYVDLRRVTLDGRLAPLVGRVLLHATADLSYDAVGGLTLGADPVATAMLHAAANRGTPVDAFVVRKAEKAHGLQRRIEGPDVKGRRVLALEDTSTTGNSVLTAVDALEADGAEVVGVAVLVDRGARQKVLDRGLPYIAVYELEELGSLVPGYRRTRSAGLSSERAALAARSLRNSRSRWITNPMIATTTTATTM
jgi:orotate phosphoribosyltransferase